MCFTGIRLLDMKLHIRLEEIRKGQREFLIFPFNYILNFLRHTVTSTEYFYGGCSHEPIQRSHIESSGVKKTGKVILLKMTAGKWTKKTELAIWSQDE